MRLIVDTSVLFSFFNEKSKARELSTLPELELYAPKFALDEIDEHKENIKEEFSLSEMQFSLIIKLLEMFVDFVPLKRYIKLFEEAMHLVPDPDDVDFFALSLKHDKTPIWSNDPHFKMQSEIRVFTTKELIEFLSYL